MPHRMPIAALALATLLPAQNHTGWSPPMPEPVLNSSMPDAFPCLSFDGRTLLFASSRSRDWDIYSATRSGPGMPWSTPTLVLGPSVPVYQDTNPFLTADGLELWFDSSWRPGGSGASDLLVCRRSSPQGPWGPAVPVVELNSLFDEYAPSLTGDGLEIYFLSTGWGNPGGVWPSIFRATRASRNEPFGTPTLVVELLTMRAHRDVEVSYDGLSLAWVEFAEQGLGFQVGHAERAARDAPWNPPAVWSELGHAVIGISRSVTGDEAIVTLEGVQPTWAELATTRFDGLTGSAETSATSMLTLHYRDAQQPGRVYAMAAALGHGGFDVAGLHVPLDPDFVFGLTWGRQLAPFAVGFLGVLDGHGEAFAAIGRSSPALRGLPVLWTCAFTLDPTAPLGLRTVSNALPFRFQ